MKTKNSLRFSALLLIGTMLFQSVGLNLVQAEEFNETKVSQNTSTPEPLVVFEKKDALSEELNQENIQKEEATKPEEKIVETLKDERDFAGITKQTTDYTCGPASLATLINLMGGNADEMQLAELSGTTKEEGTTLLELKNSAKKLGYETSLSTVSLSRLRKTKLPLLFHEKSSEDFDHYAVLKEINSETVKIADSSAGNIEVSLEEFSKVFSGKILSIALPKEIKSGQSADVALQILEEKGIDKLVVDGKMVDIDDLQEELSDQEAGMTKGKFVLVDDLGYGILLVGAAVVFTGFFGVYLSKQDSAAKGFDKIITMVKEHVSRLEKSPCSYPSYPGDIERLMNQGDKLFDKCSNKTKNSKKDKWKKIKEETRSKIKKALEKMKKKR